MKVCARGGHLLADGTNERQRGRLEDGDVDVPLAGGRGDLGPDEATTDDDRAAASVQGPADAAGVLDGAQGVHPVELLPGQLAGARTGGDDQPLVAQPLVIAKDDLPAGGVERGRGDAEPQLDVQGAQLVLGAVVRHRRFVARVEKGLGQRWPVVGQVLLGPDKDQPTGVAALAGGLDRPQAGQGRADDDEGFLGQISSRERPGTVGRRSVPTC